MMADALSNALLQNDLRDDHVHNYGSWVISTYPTCAGGEQQRVCSICTAAERKTIEKTDHNYENSVCTVCGSEEK